MAEAGKAPRCPVLQDSHEVLEYIRHTADAVHDPCGMAIGVRLGLNEMGLLRRVQIEPNANGWSVWVQLRLTSPGCQYFFLFKDTLEQRLIAHPQISRVVVDWDPSLDWTPEDLSPAAQSKLQERRHALWRSDEGEETGVTARDHEGTK
jgi:metal-sulfur cluster biosynthetic enzyme